MADGTRVEVTITVEDAMQDDVDDLSQRLAGKGLEDAVTLSSIGVISGSVARDKLEQLRGEPGVKAVELAGDVHIAPPDADVQ